MRLKLGAPDLGRHQHLVDVPAFDAAASGDGGVRVSWLGVSTLLVTDQTSSIMTDAFFSRPSLLRTGVRAIRPDVVRIDEALRIAGVETLDAIVPVHSHYDHVLDSATVALRTGARVIGGESTAHVARGHGLPEHRIDVVSGSATFAVGDFEVTLVEGTHCPPDRFPGAITAPVPRVARLRAYRCGEAWSTLVHHAPTGRRLLVQGSAGCVPGALEGQRAEVAYLGVGQLGLRSDAYVRQYWDETVGRVGAERVVLIHHDNFFRPLTKPLRAIPYTADDLDVTLERLMHLAQRDGVHLSLPHLWSATDPWR